MEDRIDVTVPLPGWMNDAIEEDLGYKDSKAEWIRDAVYARLQDERADLPDKAECPE